MVPARLDEGQPGHARPASSCRSSTKPIPGQFAKDIQGMAAHGIRINAVTVQNEPFDPGNNPSLLMLAPEQAQFVKNHLGPAFRKAGLNTKIIIYDHNADCPDYPLSILEDPVARTFIDGSAFHLYKGEISALSRVHQAHPDKNLYFTEQWIGAPGNRKATWPGTPGTSSSARRGIGPAPSWNGTSLPTRS